MTDETVRNSVLVPHISVVTSSPIVYVLLSKSGPSHLKRPLGANSSHFQGREMSLQEESSHLTLAVECQNPGQKSGAGFLLDG